MLRTYPVRQATSAPSTGNLFYRYLIENIAIPAEASHNIWYAHLEEQRRQPNKYAFRGDVPVGFISGAAPGVRSDLFPVPGKHERVLVLDLSHAQREQYNIPVHADPHDRVFDSNFKPFDQLPGFTQRSNKLAALSVAKSISSYLAGQGKINYSEQDVLHLLEKCFEDLSGPEMISFLHGNHSTWVASAYTHCVGEVKEELLREFHTQQPLDFYTKEIGIILPAMFFAAANLGKDPLALYRKLNISIPGAEEVACYMRRFNFKDEV